MAHVTPTADRKGVAGELIARQGGRGAAGTSTNQV